MDTKDASPQEFVWGPTIDEAACTDCRVCLEFCRFDVYALEDGHVRVAARASCMEGLATAPLLPPYTHRIPAGWACRSAADVL